MKTNQSILTIAMLAVISIAFPSCSQRTPVERYDLPSGCQILGIAQVPNGRIVVGCKNRRNGQNRCELRVLDDSLRLLKVYPLPLKYNYLTINGCRFLYNQVGVSVLRHDMKTGRGEADSLIFDTESVRIIRAIPYSIFLSQLNGVSSAFSPNSKYALVSNRRLGLCVFDIDGNKVKGSYTPFNALSLSCKWNSDESISWIDRKTGMRIRWFPNRPTVKESTSFAKRHDWKIENLCPDGMSYVFSDFSKGYPIIKFAEISSGKVTGEYRFPRYKTYEIGNVRWSINGRNMFVLLYDLDREDTQLFVISTRTLRQVACISEHYIIDAMYMVNRGGNGVYVCVNRSKKHYNESIVKVRLN